MENKTEYPVSSRYMIPNTPLAYADSFKGVGVEGLLEFIENVDPWYKDFTARDMRDIAAYFYAPYSAEFLVDGHWVPSDDDKVSAGLIKGLCLFEVRNVKLKLRHLSALTYKELAVLFEIAFGGKPVYPEFYKHKDFVEIKCTSTDHIIELWFDGDVKASIDAGIQEEAVCAQCPAVVRQLQEWGVYVPGTIREQFVAI